MYNEVKLPAVYFVRSIFNIKFAKIFKAFVDIVSIERWVYVRDRFLLLIPNVVQASVAGIFRCASVGESTEWQLIN